MRAAELRTSKMLVYFHHGDSGVCGDGERHVGDRALRDIDTVHQLLGVHVDRVECEALHGFLLILVRSSLKIQLSFLPSDPPWRCLSCLFLSGLCQP